MKRVIAFAATIAATVCGCPSVESEPPECAEDVECDDGDMCTADRCDPDGECAHSKVGGCDAG